MLVVVKHLVYMLALNILNKTYSFWAKVCLNRILKKCKILVK